MTTMSRSESAAMNTHELVCDFGRHAGEPYTRLPVSYLRWMVNARHSRADIAEAELKRRGTVTPDIDITGHAIDRASQRCLDLWQKSRQGPEGLHAWLHRMAVAALEKPADVNGRHRCGEIIFVIDQAGCWPVVKTVLRKSKR